MAVYTFLSQGELQEVVSLYNLGDLILSEEIKDGVENSNYLLNTESGNFIYTIYEQRASEQDLPFFLELLEFLHQQNIPCPQPIKNRKDGYFFDVKGKKSAVFTFLPGRSVEIDKECCLQLGEILAKLHLATESFPKKHDNEFSSKNLFEFCNKIQIPDSFKQIRVFLEKELLKMKEIFFSISQENLPKTIIHGDLFPDNVLFDKKKVSGLIDFYFASFDYRIYDIAICIVSWCFLEKDQKFVFDDKRQLKLLSGYKKHIKLTEKELEFLPFFLKLASLRFLLSRLEDNIKSPEKNTKLPDEYFKKLQIL